MRNRGWRRFIFCCCKFPVGPSVLLIAFTGPGEKSCSDRCFSHLHLCDRAVDTGVHFPASQRSNVKEIPSPVTRSSVILLATGRGRVTPGSLARGLYLQKHQRNLAAWGQNPSRRQSQP